MSEEHWGQTAPFPPTACCPLCGGYASLKQTKNARVTAFCSKCSSRLFLNSWPALLGYLELARQVEGKREAWSAEMDRRVDETRVGPQTSAADIDQVILRDYLDRAIAGDATAMSWVMALSDGSQALTARMQRTAVPRQQAEVTS
jgi:hypothetical protein